MRVALVYDHLNKIGGAEAVLAEFSHLFPTADWYTSIYDAKKTPFTQGWRIHTSWLQHIPLLRTHHEWIPYLMPFIFESFDFSNYDLVISISSAEGKGIITKPGTVHLNYCLTPTRYLYSHVHEYLSNSLYRWVGQILRRWDQVAAVRPDIMIAISTHVKNRIKNIYNREAEVIFPPIDIKKFSGTVSPWHGVTNYFLVVSRLVPYKKIDVLIHAANRAQKNLIVIGEGSEFKKLRELAGKTVKLMGYIPDRDLPTYYQHCLAYLQANEEDFGISMCEALSAGKPVIAYGGGGARDIVTPGKTGILLESNSVAAFTKALSEFDTMSYIPRDCQQSVSRFDKDIWITQIKERIDTLCQSI